MSADGAMSGISSSCQTIAKFIPAAVIGPQLEVSNNKRRYPPFRHRSHDISTLRPLLRPTTLLYTKVVSGLVVFTQHQILSQPSKPS